LSLLAGAPPPGGREPEMAKKPPEQAVFCA